MKESETQLCDQCEVDTDVKNIRYFPSDTHICIYCINPGFHALRELNKCQQAYNELQTVSNQQYLEGFDACLEMVLNSLDNYDSNELAKFSVWDFIEEFKEHLIEEAHLYKTDG